MAHDIDIHVLLTLPLTKGPKSGLNSMASHPFRWSLNYPSHASIPYSALVSNLCKLLLDRFHYIPSKLF